MSLDGYDNHELAPSPLRRVRSANKSAALICLALGMDALVLVIIKNRTILRFLAYPIKALFLFVSILAGRSVYRFLSKFQLVDEKNDINTAQLTTKPDWIAFVVGTLIGVSVFFFLFSIASHRMASAFDWDYQQRINDDQ
jgi:hypothetical protein